MLRGVAAVCVVAMHLQWLNGDHPRVFAKGFLAVDLFFMLSGYVMARTYEPRLAAGLSPIRFFLDRYLRLWPIMVIGSVIGLPKLFAESPTATGAMIVAGFNLLLMPAPADTLAFPLNVPAWSIFFELIVNFLHGLLLWRLGVRRLLALILVALPLTAWAAFNYGTLDVGAHASHLFGGLARAVLGYLIGIALWRWWRDTPGVPIPPLLAFVAMPVIFAIAWLSGIDDWRFDIAFIVVVCPLLIAGGLRYNNSKGPLTAVAVALGALSFPLYAVHMPVAESMRLLGFGSIGGGIAALGAAIALTIAAGYVAQRRKQHGRKSA